MENVQCIFCHTDSDRVVMEENGYAARKCPTCRLIYVSPRPTFAELQEMYSHDEAHVSTATHIAGEFRRRKIARLTLPLIQKFAKSGSILEIGSGSSYFLDEARKVGFDVYGIELNSALAEFTREKMRIPCEEAPLGESSFEGKKFDVIYHRDVISHFYDPIEEFKKINDKLTSGGIHVFETGNLGDVQEKYYSLFPLFQFPDHLFFYSERNLKDLVERTGFRLKATHRYSIVAQLRMEKMINSLVGGVKPLARARAKDEADKVVSAKAATSSPRHASGLKELARRAFNSSYINTRYGWGKVLPKEGRPLTVIVVAQKVE